MRPHATYARWAPPRLHLKTNFYLMCCHGMRVICLLVSFIQSRMMYVAYPCLSTKARLFIAEVVLARVPVGQDELRQHLDRQLRFLERSCLLFDQGDEDEAVRIAQVLRVLFRDTARQVSLTRHLGLQAMRMLDTSGALVAVNLLLDTPLVATGFGRARSARHFAPLDDCMKMRWMPFVNWWQQLVFRHQSGIRFSRSRLVCVTADQFGGAHVDTKLDAEFNDIQKGKLGMVKMENGQQVPLNDVAGVTLRQIGHEVLRSFLPHYSPADRILEFETMLTGVAVSTQSTLGAPVGRNELCPCESGLKFKKCHGSPI